MAKSEDFSKSKAIKVWMLFEVQAVREDVARDALNKHIDSLSKEEGIKLLDKEPGDVRELDAPENLKARGINKIYSYIYEVVLISHRFDDLIQSVMNYAPSSIEVLEPEEIKLNMGDLQNALTSVSDMLHKILSQGAGGLVIKR